MSKKKQTQEELIKTHVLNLNEIREAEQKENNLKFKKMPIFFALSGVLLLMMGILYPNLTEYFVKKDKIVMATKVEKNTLTCISENKSIENNLKISNKTIYTFNNYKLASSDSSTSFSILSGNDFSLLYSLRDRYNSLYNNKDNNIVYTIHVSDNILYFNSIINNYNNFNASNYNSEINTVNNTSIYHGGESIDYVRNNEEKLGNLCN